MEPCKNCKKIIKNLAKGYLSHEEAGLDISQYPYGEIKCESSCNGNILSIPDKRKIWWFKLRFVSSKELSTIPENYLLPPGRKFKDGRMYLLPEENIYFSFDEFRQKRSPDMSKLFEITKGNPFNPAELNLSAAKKKRIQPFLDRILDNQNGVHILSEESFVVSKTEGDYRVTKLQRGRAATEITLAVPA